MDDLENLYYQKLVELYLRYEIHPCTEADIEYLEHELKHKLPLAYKKFLQWAGRYNSNLFGDLGSSLYKMALERDEPIELFRENQVPLNTLPQDEILVYFNPQGYSFLFIKATDGEDPPVLMYMEHQNPTEMPFTKAYNSIWELLYGEAALSLKVEHHVEVEKEVSDYYAGVQNIIRQTIRLRQAKLFVKPCSELEITEFEKQAGYTFPKSYKQFLKWAGNGAIYLFEPSHWTPDLSLTFLRTEILSRKLPIPDDAYIIRVYYSHDFDFFRFSEGDDPPIYHCKFTMDETQISHIADTFSKYVINAIEKLK